MWLGVGCGVCDRLCVRCVYGVKAWPIGRLWRVCVAGVACGRRCVVCAGVGVWCAMALGMACVGTVCRRVYGVGCTYGVRCVCVVWCTLGVRCVCRYIDVVSV